MRLPSVFLLVLVPCLVLSSSSQDSHAVASHANLELVVYADTSSMSGQVTKDRALKHHATFKLIIKNNGSDPYSLSTTDHPLWNLAVFHQDSEAPPKWTWSGDELNITSVAPGHELQIVADWTTENDVEPGAYILAATFRPAGIVKIKEFALPSPMAANILFTGALMGYYRLPDRQPFNVTKDKDFNKQKCVGQGVDPATKPSTDAKTFFDHFAYNPADHQIRVGMGDNFAPNYYSRAFGEAGKPSVDLRDGPGKEIYYWDTLDFRWKAEATKLENRADVRTGRGTIPTDNVACFLSRAHYDAIVPGPMDFHYGPERLRELARLLASIPGNKESDFQPVQMLAANMMTKTSWSKDHEPVPDSAKRKLPFVTDYRQIVIAKDKKLQCDPDQGCSFEVMNIKDSSPVFPWLRHVHVALKQKKKTPNSITAPTVFLCNTFAEDKDPGNPDDFTAPGSFCNGEGNRRELDPQLTKAAIGKKDPDDPPEFVYDFPAIKSQFRLMPGHNYAICVRDKNDPVEAKDSKLARPYCVRFSVLTPFFQYPDWPDPEYKRSADKTNPVELQYKDPDLWVLRNDGATPVAVFGVVDPQLLEQIGADNYSWQTTTIAKSGTEKWKKDYKTQITIVDPIDALTSLEEYFSEENPEFHGIRVLLAQMPPHQVKQLAEHLPKSVPRFDVIISAADNALATPNQAVHMEPAVLPVQAGAELNHNSHSSQANNIAPTLENGALATPTTFIAIPPRHDAAEDRWLQARRLNINSDGHTYWDYEVKEAPIYVPVPSTKTLQDVEKRFWDLVYDRVCGPDSKNGCNDGPTPSPYGKRDDDSDKAAVQQLALWSMRQQAHTDIALLQEEDFYGHGLKDYLAEHCTLSPNQVAAQSPECASQPEPTLNIQQILERIIWKGDLSKIQSVTGKTLKTILKESEQFAKTEAKGYIPVSAQGRPLVTLGIKPDPDNSDDYLINGKPLDPEALYTVATSDYIALGDTGYPEMAAPTVGDPDPPALPDGKVFKISSLACDLVRLSPENGHCDPPSPADEFFDRAASLKPDDTRPGNTNLQKFYAWTFLHRRLGQRLPAPKNLPPPEALKANVQKKVDDDTNWIWSFDKLSIGFSGLSHTGSEQAISQQFGGVLNSQVTAQHFHSWDWDESSKFTFYHPKSDWFLSETLQYTSNFISQLSGPRSETQSRNLLEVNGGTYFHLHPGTGKGLPQFSLVLSGNFRTQVGSPITTLQIATSTLPLIFDQGRIMLLLGRSGLRWENRKSYVEAGLEGGGTLNAIQQFDVLVAPGGPTVPCRLEASISLTNCINTFNQINPTTPVTNLSTVSAQRNPQPRYGAYWTMKINVPINSIISYNFLNTSDYFFLSGGDNSADTRFQHTLVHTLKFMVFPNLSFEPTYTMLLFENKLDYNFLLQQQYSIKINYSFNLSNLHESKREFRYAKPSSQ